MSEYSHCNRERTDVQCRARIEEIMKQNMGQDTKVDGSGAFARFQRGKEMFKEKNKVEIHLDTNYYSGKNVVSSSNTGNDGTSPTTTKTTSTAAISTTPSGKSGEIADENGWTQSQQKALETYAI